MSSRKIVETKILELKAEGKSLREIASILGISHEGVRKRLKAVKDKDQVSTNPEYQKLTASTIKKEKVSTGPKPCKSRASEELGDIVNQVSTKETPSLSLTTGINLFKTLSLKPSEGKKEGNSLRSDDLIGEMLGFLESKGVEVYRMNVEPEGYQVKNNGQTIRIYVQRNKEETG